MEFEKKDEKDQDPQSQDERHSLSLSHSQSQIQLDSETSILEQVFWNSEVVEWLCLFDMNCSAGIIPITYILISH